MFKMLTFQRAYPLKMLPTGAIFKMLEDFWVLAPPFFGGGGGQDPENF